MNTTSRLVEREPGRYYVEIKQGNMLITISYREWLTIKKNISKSVDVILAEV